MNCPDAATRSLIYADLIGQGERTQRRATGSFKGTNCGARVDVSVAQVTSPTPIRSHRK